MSDPGLDNYMLSQDREPRKRGPPPSRAVPALQEIERRKQQREESEAQRLLREKIAARCHMPVTRERLEAGEIAFPQLLKLPKSNNPCEEATAYALWCCEVVMYRRGRDVYEEWSKGQYSLADLERLAFPGSSHTYNSYNPFTDPPSALDLESNDFPPPPAARGKKRKQAEDNPPVDEGRRKYRKLQQLMAPAVSTATASSSSKSKAQPKIATSSSSVPTPSKAIAATPTGPKPPLKAANEGKGKGKATGPGMTQGTGATHDRYGGKAIVVDEEGENMYPGHQITRGKSTSQSVKSRFVKSSIKQDKYAPTKPSPLRSIAFDAGQGSQLITPSQAHKSGFDLLQPTDEVTVRDGKLVREQRFPPRTQASISQPMPTAPRKPAATTHRPSTSQPVENASPNMPPARPRPYPVKPANKPAGTSRPGGAKRPVGPEWYSPRGVANARPHAHVEGNATHSTHTGNLHTSTNVSFSGGNASVTIGNRRSEDDEKPTKSAKKRARQNESRRRLQESRRSEQRQDTPPWSPSPPRHAQAPSSDDEHLDEAQPISEPDEELLRSQGRQTPEDDTNEEVFVLDPVTQTRVLVLRPDTSRYPDLDSDKVRYVRYYPSDIRPFLYAMSARAKVLIVVGGGGYFYRSPHPLDKTKSTSEIAYESFKWALDFKSVRLDFDQRFLLIIQPQIISFRTYTVKQLLQVVIKVFGFIEFVEDEEDIEWNKELFEKWGHLKFIYKYPTRQSKPFQHRYFRKAIRRTLYVNSSGFARRFAQLFSPVPDRYICFIATLTNRIISWFSTGILDQGRLNGEGDARTFAQVMDLIEYMRIHKQKTLWNIRTSITEYCLAKVELEKKAVGIRHVPAAERNWSPDAEEIVQSEFSDRFTQDQMRPQEPGVEPRAVALPQVELHDANIGVDYGEVEDFNRSQRAGVNQDGEGASDDDESDGESDDEVYDNDEDYDADDVEQPLEDLEDLEMPDEEMMDVADGGDAGPSMLF
ncbi:hypothetical protein FRC11_011836 [Ceratobasidium sp. 423]|nr:hypothetical protein FRC11_011836 [Ceratobasidium sp. 423]